MGSTMHGAAPGMEMINLSPDTLLGKCHKMPPQVGRQAGRLPPAGGTDQFTAWASTYSNPLVLLVTLLPPSWCAQGPPVGWNISASKCCPMAIGAG